MDSTARRRKLCTVRVNVLVVYIVSFHFKGRSIYSYVRSTYPFLKTEKEQMKCSKGLSRVGAKLPKEMLILRNGFWCWKLEAGMEWNALIKRSMTKCPFSRQKETFVECMKA
jgi:hypothetical protein